MAFVFDLGAVAARPVSRQVIVAYDEIYAIKYFGQKLRPYWRRNGATRGRNARRRRPRITLALAARCAEFDAQLLADARRVGGEKYAQICALAYRQSLAACGLAADANKQPLFFTKENTSNGDIATVDVIFPMDPQLDPAQPDAGQGLARAHPQLRCLRGTGNSPMRRTTWGPIPSRAARDDGGEGMPVEESGNMLLLCDAIAQAEGNAELRVPLVAAS